MSDLFDFKPEPSAYAVMGNPVSHSKSPLIHDLFAQQTGVSLTYDRIQVDIGGFEQAVSHFMANGGAGLNITVPYKVDAWQLCLRPGNQISERAEIAEAVNTLQFKADGGVYGDNTDGAGLVADLEKNIGLKLESKSILILGAGGAVRGVVGALLECNPTEIMVANRTARKAEELSAQFDNRTVGLGLDKIPERCFDLVINGTAASLDGKLPDVDDSCVCETTILYDMMYADQPTIFMKWGASCGAKQSFDGLGMLVEQAAESFRLWHNRHPDSQAVIQALRKS